MSYGEFVDAVAHGDKLGSTPDKAFHFNGLDGLQHFIHVGLIIPRLAIKKDGGLGNQSGFLGLLSSIGGQPFFTDLSSGSILFFIIIGSEEIDVIVIIGGGSGASGVGSLSLGELFPT